MQLNDILAHVDHTLLKQESTWEQIKAICDDGIKFNTASVCIPPSYVKECADYCAGKLKICTVIGFPNGYNTTACKVFETADAVKNGADEIDMVINIGALRDGEDAFVEADIRAVVEAAKPAIVKVIIEACYLTDAEKQRACLCSVHAGAAFVKTSTGFGSGGATAEDVALMRACVGDAAQVKAAGGIRTKEDAEKMLDAGADRIGASAGIAIVTAK